MPSEFQALLQQEADLQAEHARLLADAEAKGSVSSGARERLDAIEQALEASRQKIARMRAERELRRRAPTTPLEGEQPREPASRRARGRTYAELFGPPEASPFVDIDDFVGVVIGGRNDPRLTPMAATGLEGTGSDGGFLVPTQYSAELFDEALNESVVLPRADLYPMTSSTRVVAGFDSSDRSGGKSVGGFVPSWQGENATSTPQKAKFRAIRLKAKKLALYSQASSELFDDAPSYGELLERGLADAIADGLDDAFLNGTGAGQPLGVLNAAALIAVAKETAQAADTIVYANLVKMLARLWGPGRKRSVWIASQTTIPQLLQLTDPAGQHIPVVTQLANGEFRMLTRPLVFTDVLPPLGDQGDIVLADLSQYAVGMRREIGIDRSNAPGWYEGAIDWRAMVRVDGMSKWQEALTPRKGSDTLSPLVTLAGRA